MTHTHTVNCPYAISRGSENPLLCKKLRERQKKWEFCIHQYFCRAAGKYALNEDAAKCRMKNQQKGD